MRSLDFATHGRTGVSVETSDFRLCETVHARGLEVGVHAHPRAAVNFVVDGIYAERFAGARGEHGPHTLLFKPAGEPHSNSFVHGHARCLLVEIDQERLREAGVDTPITTTRDPALAAQAWRLLAELRHHGHDSELALESLAWELVVGVSGSPGAVCRASSMTRCETLLRDGFRESWSLSRIASEVDLHPAHLARQFRRTFGRPMGTYVRELRVAEAARLLARTELPIAAIALEAGFCDQSHCTRALRSVLGISPGRFRRRFAR